MFPLGVAVVGASAQRQGWATATHLPAIDALPDYRLAAVGTSSPESARAAAEAFGVPGHAMLGDLLAQPDVDLVTIAVKVTRSPDLVTQALESGKAVYHEWPLGRGTAEAESLARAAERAGVRTLVGLQGRYDPAVVRARELVAEGYVGTVLSTSMHAAGVSWGMTTTPSSAYLFDEASGASPLSVTAVHALDTIAAVLGEPSWLTADLSTHPQTVEITGAGSVPTTVARHVAILGRIGAAPLVLEVDGGPARGDGLTWSITGTDGELVISSPTPNGNIQSTALELRGGRRSDTGLSRLTVPSDGLPAGPAGNVARLYAAFARDLRNSTSTVPDFAHAVTRHQLVDTLLEQAAAIVPVGA